MVHLRAREEQLRKRLAELGARLHRIDDHLGQPPDPDWEDNAIEAEMDEVLEGLGHAGQCISTTAVVEMSPAGFFADFLASSVECAAGHTPCGRLHTHPLVGRPRPSSPGEVARCRRRESAAHADPTSPAGDARTGWQPHRSALPGGAGGRRHVPS